MGKKYTLLFITIFCIGMLITGGTYAYWSWNSSANKNVVFNVSPGVESYVVYNEGDSYFVGDFKPSSNYCDGIKNTISFNKTTNDVNLVATINMQINAIETNIGNSNYVYWVVTSGDSSACTGNLDDALAYGTFNGKTNNSIINMLQNVTVTTTKQEFTIWIWLDSCGSSLYSLSGKTLDTNIWTQFDMLDRDASGVYSDSILNGADPVLDSGMVPIVLSNTGVATVADKSQEWYNYGDKEWANAVLVKENATSGTTGSYSREDYLNNPGTTVLESDILAYYVWIPRYKYQIWTTDASTTTSPQTINIVFEGKDTTKSSGTAVGQYLTHPAFTFGTNNELNGIWVGKFETTGDATTPTIKPNLSSLREQNVSTQFTTSLKFAGGTMNASTGDVTFAGSNTYGLTNQTDSHMMKNSEWGAVAYLSHSQYGINSEIYINNSSGYYTGRSGGNVGGSQNTLSAQFGSGSTSTRYNSYGYYTWTGQAISSSGTIGTISDSTLGTKASTTGNVTGVYDMSGGAFEYVMGFYEGGDDYSEFSIFPNSKYYDLYTIGSNNSCTLATCGGQALYETASWYGDYANFVGSGRPWFVRGGFYNGGANAGAFYSYGYDGSDYINGSWRSVLVLGDGV